MQFNSHATNQDLISDVNFWITGSATGTTDFGINDKTRSINLYFDEVVSLIMQSDGRWEFDDNNYTDFPIATTALVASQADYEISAASFLNALRVEIKDNNGDGIQLQPISYADKQGVAMTEWAKTNATPEVYDKVGNSIVLYPTPNYSYAAGLKVYFQRIPSYFVVGDTTKTPGFNPLYHRYLSMGAALDYCSVNGMNDRVALLTGKMADMRLRIQADYSKRNRDEHLSMGTRREDYGQARVDGISENSVG